jgi:hypothetical protein
MTILYVETFTGSDTDGDGSEENPFQTTGHAHNVGRRDGCLKVGFLVITLPPSKEPVYSKINI